MAVAEAVVGGIAGGTADVAGCTVAVAGYTVAVADGTAVDIGAVVDDIVVGSVEAPVAGSMESDQTVGFAADLHLTAAEKSVAYSLG